MSLVQRNVILPLFVMLVLFQVSYGVKVLQFNILDGATTQFGNTLNIMRNSGAEIITVDEANSPSIFYRLADSLGYYHVLSICNTYNVGILSKFPIADSVKYTDPILSKSLLETKIEIASDTFIYVFATHLYPFEGATGTQRRYAEMEYILPIVARKMDRPLILAGDLNTFSHLDSTVGAKAEGLTLFIANSGFIDAYRAVHPDFHAFPGITGLGSHNRIDYIFINEEMMADNATVLDSNYYSPWPSDHNAVYAEFSIGNKWPVIITGLTVIDESTLKVTFSKTLDTMTAGNEQNYSISPDITILSAALSGPKEVVLNTTRHTFGTSYNLAVFNIRDLAIPPNVIADSQNSWGYVFNNTRTDTIRILEDAYVSGESVASNYGSNTILLIDGDQGIKLAYLKADFASIDTVNRIIDSILFFITVANGTYSASSNGGHLVLVHDNTWREASITYANRPAISTDTLGALGQVNLNTTYGIKLDPANVIFDTLSFALITGSADAAEYYSREGGKPPIIIVYSRPISPTASEGGAPATGDGKCSIEAWPNPFNPSTVISYSVPGLAGVGNAWVKLEVVNIQGKLVKTLVNGMKTPGSRSVCWNGTDNLGKRVGSGAYFYRLRCGEKVLQKQMVYLR